VEIARSAVLVNHRRLELRGDTTIDHDVRLIGGEHSPHLLKIAVSTTIRGGSYVSARLGHVEIGSNGYIGHHVWIGGRGRTSIGPWFLCAPNVTIISSNHDYRDRSRPYAEQEEIVGKIEIGENVWIGATCVVLPGATVGDGAVIAAGSVVRGSVPARTLAAGNPAVLVRELDDNDDAVVRARQ
jgi:acetyltransferase-like isoleucine patch superfamily enzyme